MLTENTLRNMKDVDGLEDDNNKANHNIFITIEKSGHKDQGTTYYPDVILNQFDLIPRKNQKLF